MGLSFLLAGVKEHSQVQCSLAFPLVHDWMFGNLKHSTLGVAPGAMVVS